MKAFVSGLFATLVGTIAAAQTLAPADEFAHSLECAAILGLKWTDGKGADSPAPQTAREAQAKAAFEEAVKLGAPLGYGRNQVAARYFQAIDQHADALKAGRETDEDLEKAGNACAGAAGSI